MKLAFRHPRRNKVGKDWKYFVEQGRKAWEEHGGNGPPAPKSGWQAKAWKEGFDKAYEKERPSLDLDHQAQVAQRRASFKLIKGKKK